MYCIAEFEICDPIVDVIGSAKATSKGKFTVKIPKQKAGKNLYIYAGFFM
ncbi:Ig-like domain-containing protein [Peribacillus butanolivorans]|nr:hypothetical protein [Peribacillus butanolivorans]QNU03862.1 hypothetical protein GM240_07840 [Peribacillus butanolivorans]